jgi:hypothetical protein
MSNAKTPPKLSSAGTRAADTRKARLAAALRENLRKRKAQARERASAARPDSPPDRER